MLKSLQGSLDHERFKFVENEHEVRAAISVRPGRQVLWGVDDMLHAVKNHRASGADVQQPFDPQNAFAVGV